MWRCEHSVVAKTSKAAVWALWSDVENWPKWDTDLTEAAIQGEWEQGVEGRIKVADDAVVAFTITELVPEERFVTTTKMFGARLVFIHELSEEEGGIKITHRSEIRGFLGWFWRLFIAKKVKATLAPGLENLAKLAEQAPAPTAATEKKEVASAEPAADEQVAQPASEEPVEQTACEQADAKAPEEMAQPEQPAENADSKQVSAEQETPASQITEAVEGDPKENEVREKDIREQIEEAAKAPEPEVPVPDTEPVQEKAEKTEEPVPSTPKAEQEEPAAEPDVPNDAPGVTTPSAEAEQPASESATPTEPAPAQEPQAPAAEQTEKKE